MTDRDPALEPFDVLIGGWALEAKHRLVDEVVLGVTTFEWLEGGRYLIQRSHMEHELLPDGISVIGPPEDGDGLVLESFDSRGVRRTYGTSLEDGVWRIWRDAPGFDQRFSAEVGGDVFEGVFQLAETPGEWQDDLKVTYRRRGVIHRIVPNLKVRDAGAGHDFYTDFLGLQPEFDLGWVASFRSRQNRAIQVSLVTGDASAPQDSAISVAVGDVDAAYEEARRRGYEIVHPLTDEPWGTRRFFVRDPNGVVVNVVRHLD